MRGKILRAAIIVISCIVLLGCREIDSPPSSSGPPPTQVWDSLGLAGSTIQTIAADRRRIFVGTSNGFYRSLDSGRAWFFTDAIYGRSSFSSIVISGPNVLVGTDTNLSISSDDGTTWGLLLDPINVFAMAQGSEFLFVASSLGIIRSSNHGLYWTFASSGLPLPLSEVRGFAAEGTTLCLALVSAVYVSLNNGDSWTQVQTPWPPHTIARVFFNKSIFYVATTGGMYTSRTQGNSWMLAAVGIPETSQVVAFAAITSGVYAGTNNAGVLSSANGGVTWTSGNFNLPDLQITALAADGNFVYAGTRRRGLWRFTR